MLVVQFFLSLDGRGADKVGGEGETHKPPLPALRVTFPIKGKEINFAPKPRPRPTRLSRA